MESQMVSTTREQSQNSEHITATNHAVDGMSFLDLPPEIRNEIYRLCLISNVLYLRVSCSNCADRTFVVYFMPMARRSRHATRPRQRRRAPEIIFCNKQTNAEALGMLYNRPLLSQNTACFEAL
jgi:2EXR family protein